MYMNPEVTTTHSTTIISLVCLWYKVRLCNAVGCYHCNTPLPAASK